MKMEKKTLKYVAHGNDLYTDRFECECPSESFKGTPVEHLMKTQIYLTGYNDNYFFDEVNKEPRVYKCSCGKEYKFQWFRHGVEVEGVSKYA